MLEQSFSENPFSDGDQKCCPRNQTIRSANLAYFKPSDRSTKPVEIGVSRSFNRPEGSQWGRRNLEVGETSGSDRIASETPVEDDLDGMKEEYGDDEDDLMCEDFDYDSDDLSLDVAKKSRWLRGFFEWLDSLSKDRINDPAIRMHCPACKGGAGANAWYTGFHAVVTHAETMKSRRVKLHQWFAEILSGELKDRNTRYLASNQGESLEWKGLGEEIEDHMIVWPPMVIVQNTRSRKDETGKWIGMGRPELNRYFEHYNFKNAKSAYGPAGHCGVSVLIFESAEVGHIEAERLHKQFLKEGRGRYEWENLRRHLHSMREHLLFGYMATREDMELFNKHSKGKQNCKFEMKSYQTMVIDSLTKMRDNDSKLIGLEDKIARETEENEILKKAYESANEKLHLREHEIQTIRRKASEELEGSKNEVDCLDKHYGDMIKELTDQLENVKMELEVLLQKSSESSQKLVLRENEIQTVRRRASEELYDESKDQIEYLEKCYGDSIEKLTDELEKVKLEQKEMQTSPSPTKFNEP